MVSKTVLIYIVGPTGSGKTQLALSLSELSDGPIEVVSADSRQIYRYMDVCTGKPSPADLSALPHHLIDIRNPDEDYSVGEFQKEACEAVAAVFERGNIPVIVGGTGLYIRSLTDGLIGGIEKNAAARKRLEDRAASEGPEALHDELKQIDPESAGNIHSNDLKRVIRALEVFETRGVPLSELRKTGNRQLVDQEPVMLGLSMERPVLYDRINRRVDAMLKSGAIEETKKLLKMGYDASLKSMETFGYREIVDHLEGRLTLEQMTEVFKQHSRNYAKRQLTWFRKDTRINWIDPNTLDLPELTRRLRLS